MLVVVISIMFGFVAIAAFYIIGQSGLRGLVVGRAIRRELAAIAARRDRPVRALPVPLPAGRRQPWFAAA